MGAVGKIFDDIGNAFEEIAKAIKTIAKEMVDCLKLAVDSFVGAFKQLYECTIALAQAIATGDFKKMALKLLELGTAILTIAQPELLAVSIGAQVAMKLVKDTITLAANALGIKMQPWMQDVVGMMDVGSNFTSFGNAAVAMGTELLANVAGEKGPLQSEWENCHPELPKDENYKKIHEQSLAYEENHEEETRETSNAI